jgi:hypothetical protein
MSAQQWQSVQIGTWVCQWCGARWVGRWNGPKSLITCLVCEERLYDDDGNLLKREDDEALDR